jgi:hypothetical protein
MSVERCTSSNTIVKFFCFVLFLFVVGCLLCVVVCPLFACCSVMSLFLQVDAAVSRGAPVYSSLPLTSLPSLQQLLNGEVDAAMVTPDLLAGDSKWRHLLAEDQVTLLPAFITGTTHNTTTGVWNWNWNCN